MKTSPTKKNWVRYLLQWGVLLAIIVFVTGLVRTIFPKMEPADPEAFCPLGGLEALATYGVRGSLPCSMSSLQIILGICLAAAVILFSKLFCGYLCPVGTVQDLLMKLRKAIGLKGIRIKNGSVGDKILRIVKYALVFWLFYMTATASELFCKNLDPYYAVATGFKGEITLWMSIVTVSLVVLGSFLVDMFWCRYLCPQLPQVLGMDPWAGAPVVGAGSHRPCNSLVGAPWRPLPGRLSPGNSLRQAQAATPSYYKGR